MNKYITPAFISGLKELLRTALFAAIPVLIAQIKIGYINIEVIEIAIIIAILSGVSEWLHKDAQAKSPKMRNEGFLGVRGLSGF